MTRRWTVGVLAVVGSAGLWASEAGSRVPSEAIRLGLEVSAEAWNRGDLEGFLAPYAESATYMSAEGPIGQEEMGEYFRAKYFAGGKPGQALRFEAVTVRPLGVGHALATGRYVLSGGGREERSGWFTLVWTETPAGWRILHDHSS